MKVIATLLLVAVASACAKDIKFEDCAGGQVKRLSLAPCSAEPCMFNKGEEVSFSADMVADVDAAKGEVKMTVEVDGIELEYPGVEPDVCKLVSCPITKGTKYTINYKLAVQDYFPATETTIKFRVIPESGSDLFCAKVQAGIQ